MNRSDLVDQLAARFGQLTQRDADLAVTAILEAMMVAMASRRHIELRGFGSSSITHRAPRVGRNPRSGAPVLIPQKRVPHFKAGKAMRTAIDERTEAMNAHPMQGQAAGT